MWIERYGPGLVFALSVGLNLLTVWRTGFDGLYGQDAYSYFTHAGELRSNFSLYHHWQWEALPRPLYWPVGYPVLLALWFVLTGPSAGSGQLLTILSWGGTAALVTLIGGKLGDDRAGLFAGLFMALSPLGRQVGISFMADAPALFWTVLAAWLILLERERKQGWYLVGAGLALGLAGITRYAALTAFPLLVIGAIWSGVRWRQLRWLGLALIAAGLVYLPQFVINQLNPASFWENSWLTDWSPLNAFQTRFVTRDGAATYPSPPLPFYLVWTLLNPRFLTPVLLPLFGAGFFCLWQKRAWFETVWLSAWWLLPVLIFSGIHYEGERYTLTFLPPLALLGGLGLSWLIGYTLAFGKAKMGQLQRVKWVVVSLTILGFVGLGLLSERHLNGFVALKTADLATVRQVEAALPTQATLVTFDLTLTFDHYTPLHLRDLFFISDADAENLVRQSNVYLLADPDRMAEQWAGQPTGRAFDKIRAQSGQPIGRFGRFVLWKVGP